MESPEVELQSLAHDAETDSGGDDDDDECFRLKTSDSEQWANPHDGSLRRRHCLLGACFLVVLVCSSIFYGNLKKCKRASQSGQTTTNGSSVGNVASHEPQAFTKTDDTPGLSVEDIYNERTARLDVDINGIQREFQVTPIALRQIKNFRKGNGILLNIHITHHAGTTICGALGRAPGQRGAPASSCNGETVEQNATIHEYFQATGHPWSGDDTGTNIDLFSQFYHMLSWEFSSPHEIPLNDTNWEHPQLVSMIVMRDPLSRLLAGDHRTKVHFPNILRGNASHEEWWEYARSTNTDNFAMRVLAGRGCCQGQDTSPIHLVHAKELVRRFSFVLDIACLNEGITAVAHSLGFEPKSRRDLEQVGEQILVAEERHLSRTVTHPPPSERIPFSDVYEFLKLRNKYDIDLYEWSKEISLIRCQ